LDISTDKATSGMSCLPILGSSLSQASQTSNKLYFSLSVKSALEETIKIFNIISLRIWGDYPIGWMCFNDCGKRISSP
jgi:hypothetical protein